MKRLKASAGFSFLCTLCVCASTARGCFGQSNQTVILTIKVQPAAKLAASTGGSAATSPQPGSSINNGRIVAVNNSPAAGSWTESNGLYPIVGASVVLGPEQSLSPVVWTFDISESDHTHAGTMVAMERPKLSRNLKGTGRELTIVSGTGAYLGVQGTISQSTDQTTNIQVESRDFSQLTFSASLMPATLPVIASVAGGPAITHADFSLVTASQPAAPGEVLTAYATDLMPELESPPVNGGSSVSSMTGLPI